MKQFSSLRRRFNVRAVLSLALVLCFGVSVAAPAYAAGGQTGNLSGQILDNDSSAPISGATVAAVSPSGSGSSKTDGQGRFSILGLPVDTYTVSVEAQGYEAYAQTGITVTGDQTLALGSVKIAKRLRTIGRVRARSAGDAFQPTQTVDQYTVSGARVDQALGKKASFDENQLLLSVPGASTTNTGRVTIRGGLATEVGYQLDGVNFTEPFFSTNASSGKFNGLGALQVVEGAGDATQGNIGGGVVNIIPKRGTLPAFGLLDFETTGPNFNHQFSFEYGIATQNGRLSDYFAYVGQRGVPYYGYHNQNPAETANYFGSSYDINDDILNNLVFRFGKNNHQSLQLLVDIRDLQHRGEVGGLTGLSYYPYDPYVVNNNLFGTNIAQFFPGIPNNPNGQNQNYANYIGLAPYTPSSNQPVTSSQIVGWDPTNFLKLEYTNNLNASTYLVLRGFNWESLKGFQDLIDGSSNPSTSVTGGRTTGFSGELTKSLGDRHTVTLAASYSNLHPIWDNYAPLETPLALLIAGPNSGASPPSVSLGDFFPNGGTSSTPGWVFQHLGAMRLPVVGINYNKTDFQEYGVGLRDQWSVNSKLKLDYGARVDGAHYKFGANPYNPNLANPTDVDPSFITHSILNPTAFEPRIAAAYQFGRNDAVRFGFGRSINFLNAQTAGTPAAMFGAGPLFNVPVTPGSNTTDPSTWTCGSGLNTANLLPPVNGKIPNLGPKGGGFFRCQNYAQEMFWAYDQNFDAPDIGNGHVPSYSNTDLTYTHQFPNGWGTRLTGFYKRASGLPSFFILAEKIDPVTGAILYQVFSVNNNSINKTPGAEFSITTPDRPVGVNAYFSATYQNVLSSVPPLIGGEDVLPLVNLSSFALGNVYRAGFVSPFSARLGATLKTKSGFRVNPNLNFNVGFPYGVGNLIAPSGQINGKFYNIPQTNLGIASPTGQGFQATTGSPVATNYVDPAYPGSYLFPNIAASRGTPEKSAAGGTLSHPSLTGDMTFEFNRKRHTVGLQIQNVFGNVYAGQLPQVNSYYQPVTTGVAGPQTGQSFQANPQQQVGPGSFVNKGFVNLPASLYGQSPYLLLPDQPMTFRAYYQLAL
jgi:hypothetical protein